MPFRPVPRTCHQCEQDCTNNFCRVAPMIYQAGVLYQLRGLTFCSTQCLKAFIDERL